MSEMRPNLPSDEGRELGPFLAGFCEKAEKVNAEKEQGMSRPIDPLREVECECDPEYSHRCFKCGGRGWVPKPDYEKCPLCHGEGLRLKVGAGERG